MFSKSCNIAIVLGEVSSTVVRDFDDKEEYAKWSSGHPDLAATAPTVQTSSGYHVYVTMDPIPRLKVSGVKNGELRGTGAYVLAPPSIHPTGHQYAWVNPLIDALPVVTFQDLDLGHLCGFSQGFSSISTPTTEERQKRHRRAQKSTEENRRELKPLGEIKKSPVEVQGYDLEEFVRRSLPVKIGQRERKLFDLARRLKRHNPSKSQLVVAFDKWWSAAKDIVGTKGYEVSMNTFLRGFKRVEVPLDEIVGNCLQIAESNPPPSWSHRFNPKCQLLAGLCRELQAYHGEEPFFLSCRKAGECLGIRHDIANAWLQLFVELEELKIAIPGTTHRATRYRYVAED